MTKACNICSKTFTASGKRRKLTAKFCSVICHAKGKKGCTPWNKGLKGSQPPPWNKGKTGIYSIETRKIMGADKLGKLGSLAKNWQGGKTDLRHQIRNSTVYKSWRKSIFERDNFTCQMCFVRGINLNIDHYPKTFATIVKENNIKSIDDAFACDELWNIITNRTLCLNCHKLTPTYLSGGLLKKNIIA